MASIERRMYTSELVAETRDDGSALIRGHASVFNSMSEDLGFFREIVRPGAFSGVLGDDVRSLINHDANLVLGRTVSKTLRISEDQRGLYQETDPPATSYAQDLLVVMGRGDVNQQSISFDVGTDNWRMENGEQVREVIAFKRLYDVSVVTFPAFPVTDAQVRSVCLESGLDFEGLSAAFVKAFRHLETTPADRDVLRRAAAIFTEASKEDRGQEPGDPPAEKSADHLVGLWRLRQQLFLASQT